MRATKRLLQLSVATLVAVPLAACQNMQDSPKQTAGTLVGAGLGALAGSQIGSGKGQLAAVAIGALAGAWMGSEVGASLDKADKMYAQRSAQQSLEYNQAGQATAWRNPDSGHSGTVTPTRTYRTADGQNCREFEQTIYVDGKQETAKGRACRRTDGTWQIVQ
ncbi:MAG: glycine zipper 2TM domain-containing protein [Rhodospirillales bacterium]|nr:glycine zipper 2TM domain-containing protein [Rhodospirillales bacterium]MBI2584992.1 glycine zipper 2TM domain-containing protein [Rhodospirillales bacterium]